MGHNTCARLSRVRVERNAKTRKCHHRIIKTKAAWGCDVSVTPAISRPGMSHACSMPSCENIMGKESRLGLRQQRSKARERQKLAGGDKADDIIRHVKAEAPVLRPDEPMPTQPVL